MLASGIRHVLYVEEKTSPKNFYFYGDLENRMRREPGFEKFSTSTYQDAIDSQVEDQFVVKDSIKVPKLDNERIRNPRRTIFYLSPTAPEHVKVLANHLRDPLMSLFRDLHDAMPVDVPVSVVNANEPKTIEIITQWNHGLTREQARKIVKGRHFKGFTQRRWIDFKNALFEANTEETVRAWEALTRPDRDRVIDLLNSKLETMYQQGIDRAKKA